MLGLCITPGVTASTHRFKSNLEVSESMICIVEAGLGGSVRLVSQAGTFNISALEDRVKSVVLEAVDPPTMRDLRIKIWVTIEFEVDEREKATVSYLARDYLDSIVDILSISAGQEVRILHWSHRVRHAKGTTLTLRPISMTSPVLEFDPYTLLSASLNERQKRALRHLRHGLATVSPERRFMSLLLAVMILSREFEFDVQRVTSCKNCGHVVEARGPGERDRLLNLANVLPGWTVERIMAFWKLRNDIMGHGNKPLSAKAAGVLLEASFDVATLAYDALNACLPELNLAGPSPLWFVTDLEYLMSIGERAHETTIDVLVDQVSEGNWSARWPAHNPTAFTALSGEEAVDKAKAFAQKTLKEVSRRGDGFPAIIRDTVYL
jgi:hypothetical protein